MQDICALKHVTLTLLDELPESVRLVPVVAESQGHDEPAHAGAPGSMGSECGVVWNNAISVSEMSERVIVQGWVPVQEGPTQD